MKKFLMAIVVAALTVMACVAMVACGETTYSGEYKYENPYALGSGNYYGVAVDVTVSGGKITKVVCKDETDTLHNITPTWANHDTAAAGLADYLKKFEGVKVSDVKAIEVSKNDKGVPNTDDAAKTAQGDLLYSGATQTSGRIILAVQDALKDVK